MDHNPENRTMLSCNVTIQERVAGQVEISAMDPVAVFGLFGISVFQNILLTYRMGDKVK